MVLVFDLPVEVFLPVFRHVSIQDVLNIRQTCKNFFAVTQLWSVWYMLFHIHVQLENIPVPRLPRGLSGNSLESFTASQLEKYVLDALRLRRNWRNPSPPVARRVEIACGPYLSIVDFQFLPERENRWLISSALAYVGREQKFALQCWDLEADPPVCVATKFLPRPGSGSLTVNTDSTSTAVLAVQSPFVEILTIDFDSPDAASAFVSVARFPEKVHGLHVLAGTTLLTRDADDHLFLWDIESPDNQVELRRNPESQPEQILQAIVRDHIAIIVWPTMLEIYGIPDQTFSTVIYPVAYHPWQWKLDSACVSFQASWEAAQNNQLPPIGILVRYGSLLPWPINLLHQYVLQSNKSYDPLSPVDVTNIPYHPTPVLQRTIGSPISLFGKYHMALGTHGMAIWLDNHTEHYFGGGGRGQRLAGCLLPEDSANEEVVPDSQIDSTMWTSVFEVSGSDGWVRVALSEREGKIAVGNCQGVITILEYV